MTDEQFGRLLDEISGITQALATLADRVMAIETALKEGYPNTAKP